jgi:hypothetical protein
MNVDGRKMADEALRSPPNLLIFFHIPKTGGTTMDAILARCFPGTEHFDGQVGTSTSGLALRPRDRIAAKYHALSSADQAAIRCVMGTHYPFGIETLFGRPAKYFTILRPPVERAASHFFDDRTQRHLACYDQIKTMTLDQYLDSGLGITAYDNQVRLLSGCPELDVPLDPGGGPISAPPVEPRHLEMAKQNIERQFVTAAPLDSFTSLLMILRQMYGWKMHRMVYVRHNVAAKRATPTEPISPATRRRLEQTNQYDMALYSWVKARFAAQVASLEPGISRDCRRYESLNAVAQRIDQVVPAQLRRRVTRVLSSHGPR